MNFSYLFTRLPGGRGETVYQETKGVTLPWLLPSYLLVICVERETKGFGIVSGTQVKRARAVPTYRLPSEKQKAFWLGLVKGKSLILSSALQSLDGSALVDCQREPESEGA